MSIRILEALGTAVVGVGLAFIIYCAGCFVLKQIEKRTRSISISPGNNIID